MAMEYKVDVTVRYEGRGTEAAEEALLNCFEEQRFWEALRPAFQEAFIQAVQDVTGEVVQYELTVQEDVGLRYARKRLEQSEELRREGDK